jgi:hypothetical protein
MRAHVKDRIDEIIGMIYESNIVTSFPTSSMLLLKYIDNCEWTDYRRLAEKNRTDIDGIAHYLGSRDGCTIYQRSRDRYLIAVNTDQHFPRLRWTTAHEFGHIFAGHFFEIEGQILQKQWYMEEEADYFAASFLAPLPAICMLRISSEKQLMETFGLSKTAAALRWREYQESGFGWKGRSAPRRVKPVNIWPEEGENWAL